VFGPTWRSCTPGASARRRRGGASARRCWRWPRGHAALRLPPADGARAGAALAAGRGRPRFYALKANPHPACCARWRPRASASSACRRASSSTCSRRCPDSPQRVLFTPSFAPRAEYAAALARGVHVTARQRSRAAALAGACSAGRDLCCAWTRASVAATTRRCAPAATRPSSAWRSRLPAFLARRARSACASSACTRTSAAASSIPATGARCTRSWRPGRGHRQCRKHRRRRRPGRALPPDAEPFDSTWPRGARPGRDQGGLPAATRCGSSPAATWSPRPACCCPRHPGGGQGRRAPDRRRCRHERAAAPGAVQRLARDRQPDRLDEPADTAADVVGPICETGDVLGRGAAAGATAAGDVLLVATPAPTARSWPTPTTCARCRARTCSMMADWTLRPRRDRALPLRRCALDPASGEAQAGLRLRRWPGAGRDGALPGAPFALDAPRAAGGRAALRLLHLIAGVSYYKAAVPARSPSTVPHRRPPPPRCWRGLRERPGRVRLPQRLALRGRIRFPHEARAGCIRPRRSACATTPWWRSAAARTRWCRSRRCARRRGADRGLDRRFAADPRVRRAHRPADAEHRPRSWRRSCSTQPAGRLERPHPGDRGELGDPGAGGAAARHRPGGVLQRALGELRQPIPRHAARSTTSGPRAGSSSARSARTCSAMSPPTCTTTRCCGRCRSWRWRASSRSRPLRRALLQLQPQLPHARRAPGQPLVRSARSATSCSWRWRRSCPSRGWSAIFGRNLLDEPAQAAGFDALIEYRDHKPFECVGEGRESRAAMARWRSAGVARGRAGAALRARDPAAAGRG
jgi:hypothetical protein